LLNQHGQVAAGEAVLVAAATLAVAVVLAGSLVAALARRRLSTVAAFAEHPLSGARTLAAEVLAARHLDSIMVVLACLL